MSRKNYETQKLTVKLNVEKNYLVLICRQKKIKFVQQMPGI